MLSENYFTAELASHTLETVQRIREVCNLDNVSTSYLYDYLLHSERWMPEFARMVSSWIIYDRRRKYVATTGVQFDRTDNDLLSVTVTFKQKFVIDLKDRVPTQRHNYATVRPAPRFQPVKPAPRIPSPSKSSRPASTTEELLMQKFGHVDM